MELLAECREATTSGLMARDLVRQRSDAGSLRLQTRVTPNRSLGNPSNFQEGLSGRGHGVLQAARRTMQIERHLAEPRIAKQTMSTAGDACGQKDGPVSAQNDLDTPADGSHRPLAAMPYASNSDLPPSSAVGERRNNKTAIKCLFVDIGGVLLTDGWDHRARKRAASTFKLKFAHVEERHQSALDVYEEGRLTLEEYLGRWSSIESDRLPGLSFDASCWRNRNLTPR